jgi:hypothetical protein
MQENAEHKIINNNYPEIVRRNGIRHISGASDALYFQ